MMMHRRFWQIISTSYILCIAAFSVAADTLNPLTPAPEGLQWGWQTAVQFKLNSSHLNKPEKIVLKQIAQQLVLHKDIIVLLTGHTDNTGDVEYNRQLSLKRVHAVKQYLVKQGVFVARIQQQAVGENSPVASNRCKNDRQRNRRVDIAFYPVNTPLPSITINMGYDTQPHAGECKKTLQ